MGWNPSVDKRKALRSALRQRDGDDCHICGGLMVFGNPHNEDYATIDHLHPHSAGGSNGLSNLKLAHKRCNHARGDLPLELVSRSIAA